MPTTCSGLCSLIQLLYACHTCIPAAIAVLKQINTMPVKCGSACTTYSEMLLHSQECTRPTLTLRLCSDTASSQTALLQKAASHSHTTHTTHTTHSHTTHTAHTTHSHTTHTTRTTHSHTTHTTIPYQLLVHDLTFCSNLFNPLSCSQQALALT